MDLLQPFLPHKLWNNIECCHTSIHKVKPFSVKVKRNVQNLELFLVDNQSFLSMKRKIGTQSNNGSLYELSLFDKKLLNNKLRELVCNQEATPCFGCRGILSYH